MRHFTSGFVSQAARIFTTVGHVASLQPQSRLRRGEKFAALEGCVFNRCLDHVYAILLPAFSLSFLALDSIAGKLKKLTPAVPGRDLSRSRCREQEIKPLSLGGEFCFERAIESYEALIDATIAQRHR
jgi:hypothetical protein